VEVPASSLPGEESPVETVEFEAGLQCTIIGIEDLIIDRLNACKHWQSETDCEMVALLLDLSTGPGTGCRASSRVCGRCFSPEEEDTNCHSAFGRSGNSNAPPFSAGAAREDPPHGAGKPGEPGGGKTEEGLRMRVRTDLEKAVHHRPVPEHRRVHEGGATTAVVSVDGSPALEQRLDEGQVPLERDPSKGRLTVVVAPVDLGSASQEHASGFLPSPVGGKHQQRVAP
jgi:hypothetical protein